MGDFSKLITAAPIVIGLLLVGIDYIDVEDQYEITQSHIDMFEWIIGGTIFGGVANAGFKRYTQYKEKVTNPKS